MMYFMNKNGCWPAYYLRGQLLFLKQIIVCTIFVLFGMQTAWADVWGYVDDKGVVHLANEKVDDRYELYFRVGQHLDEEPRKNIYNEKTNAEKPNALPRPVAVPAAPPKLLAFFEVSTNYKATRHLLRDAAKQHKLDYDLLKALIATESGFDPQALSPKGAVGLMQIIPPTAERYGLTGDEKTPIEKKLSDPKTNIRIGTRYLSDLSKMFPDQIELVLAAYNAGEGSVKRYGNKIPPFKETQNYVQTVLQLYSYLKPPGMVANPVVQQTPDGKRVRVQLGAIPGRGNMVPPIKSVKPAGAAAPNVVVPVLPAAPRSYTSLESF
jgi:hypothetical protein